LWDKRGDLITEASTAVGDSVKQLLQSIKYVTQPLALVAFALVVLLLVIWQMGKKKGGAAGYPPEATMRLGLILLTIVFLGSFASWMFAEIFGPGTHKKDAKAELKVTSAVYKDGLIDLALINEGDSAAVISEIQLKVMKDFRRTLQPVVPPSEHVKIPIGGLAEGQVKKATLKDPVAVPPHGADRIQIIPDSTRVVKLEVSLIYNDDQVAKAEVTTKKSEEE
jgi:hypothetical protein